MVKNIFKITITIFLLSYLLIYIVDLKEVVRNLAGIEWSFYLIAYFINLTGIFVSAIRWQGILYVKNIQCKYLDLVSYYFIGIFYNNFIPGSIGGDAIKMYKLSREEEKRTDLISSVVNERFVGLLVVWMTAIIVFIFQYSDLDDEFRIPFMFILIGHMCVIISLSSKRTFDSIMKFCTNRVKISARLQERIYEIYNSVNFVKELNNNKWGAILVFSSSIVFFFCTYIGEVFVLLYALDYPLSYIYLLSFLPMLNLIVMVPISFGGLGVREVMYVYFLGREGISSEVALSLGVLLLSFRILNSLFGAIINMAKD